MNRHPIPSTQHHYHLDHPPSVSGDNLGSPDMGPMEIGGMLNNRGHIADVQYRHQLQQNIQMNHSAYAMNHPQPMPILHHPHHHHQHSLSQPNALAYNHMSGPSHHQQMMPHNYMSQHAAASNTASQMDTTNTRPRSEPAPKAFACNTCQKGFARRSDLARHERIHSGIRPHACEHPGCGKQFIQRSALTVHARVHTGEKPHMCERCGKPFSDSSSLARHRRIHSGKRPYKCPYANCQKTFTRRTTLTRHQNHHTGTVEQAQAETTAKLSMTQAPNQLQSANGSYSDDPSHRSSTSPTETQSLSPPQDAATAPATTTMQGIPKQMTDFQFMAHQNTNMQSHVRNDYQVGANRSIQTFPNSGMQNYTHSPHGRIVMGSHTPNYVMPQSSEAGSTNSTTVAGATSPHLAGMSWQQANSAGLTQPPLDFNYQDPAFNSHTMYYPASNIRRPQSTEPDEYGLPRRQMGHSMVTGNMQAVHQEWGAMPMGLHHEIKQERGFV